MNSNYLQHYGIKGMKWGYRKQEEDGTITRRGEKHIRSNIWKPESKKISWQNRNQIHKKHSEEMNNSKEKRDYDELIKKRGIAIKDKSGKTVSYKLSYMKDDWSKPDKVMNQMIKDAAIQEAYRKKDAAIAKKYTDQYMSATLKDLGYKDNKKAVEWMKNNIARQY